MIYRHSITNSVVDTSTRFYNDAYGNSQILTINVTNYVIRSNAYEELE